MLGPSVSNHVTILRDRPPHAITPLNFSQLWAYISKYGGEEKGGYWGEPWFSRPRFAIKQPPTLCHFDLSYSKTFACLIQPSILCVSFLLLKLLPVAVGYCPDNHWALPIGFKDPHRWLTLLPSLLVIWGWLLLTMASCEATYLLRVSWQLTCDFWCAVRPDLWP